MTKHAAPPSLVTHYERATLDTYHTGRRVKQKDWPKFAKAETELSRRGIDCEHYAKTVCKLWTYWVHSKHFRCLPINVFLGPKSRNWYEGYALFAVDVVRPGVAKAHTLQDEITVGLMYIDAGCRISIADIAENLNLSSYWRQAYEEQLRPTVEAAEIICKLRGIEAFSTNYNTIARAINERCRSLRVE